MTRQVNPPGPTSMSLSLFLDDHFEIKSRHSDLLACIWVSTWSPVLLGQDDIRGGAILVVARLPHLCSVVVESKSVNFCLIMKSAIN